ncbi:quinone oxidoreductase [Hymenopellis radicata]|nr:quinone oxidoreductase [Hymenopellis radicata]
MRAVLIKDGKGPVENLYIGEVPTPSLGNGQILVRIKAFGLNRMDILQRNGNYPVPPGASTLLGVEFSGIIAQLGQGVSDEWADGDEVFGIAGGGAYAEYIVVNPTHLMHKPLKLSWAEAASVPEVFLTAYQGIHVYGRLQGTESVLIHAAASGVGIAAIQMARAAGATNVIATASTKEKLDWLRSIPNGATHAVNYTTQDFSEEVRKITSGAGVNVILDFVGTTHWDKNIDSLGIDGRMVIFAFLSGSAIPTADLAPILRKRLQITGSTLRSRSLQYQADLISQLKTEYLGKVSGKDGDGVIRTYIHKIFNWSDIQAAHKEMEANKNIGKIIAEIV